MRWLVLVSLGWFVACGVDTAPDEPRPGDANAYARIGDGAADVRIVASDAAAGDTFGVASGAGDVDGDGYGDLVVGAPGADTTGTDAGAAYVYYGAPGGIDATREELVVPADVLGHDELGYAVAAAGDLDRDGYADFLVSAVDSDTYAVDAGAAYLYFGGASGVDTARVQELGPTVVHGSAWFGRAVAGLGDLDGDGLDDFAVSANGDKRTTFAPFTGAAYVYFGDGAGYDPARTTRLAPSDGASNDNFGYGLAAGGDLDGDGYRDLLAGAPNAHGTGVAYAYYGGASGIDGSRETRLLPADVGSGDLFGLSVAGAGDLDRDGFDDVVVGAYGDDDLGSAAGAVYVLSGSAAGPDSATATRHTAPDGEASDWFGIRVAALGDIDADGFPEVAVASTGDDDGGSGTGAVYVYSGSASGFQDSSARKLVPTDAGANAAFGNRLATAGDVDGDGTADLVVGAPFDGAGAAYLYLAGPAADADGDGAASDVDCDDGDPTVYPGADDPCGDGVDQDCDGVDATCAGACTVELTYPADGADLSAEGRFVWDGDCDGYWLELSPSPAFPAYDTVYNARLSDAAGPQPLSFPAAAWPNVSRRFAAGGYARVVGGLGGETAVSATVSFDTAGVLSAFPTPAATCSVSLVEPADGSALSGSPTFGWTTGCTAARLEFSANRDFPVEETVVIGAFSGNRATLDAARWSTVATALPDGGYWRVVAGASDGEHHSGRRTFVLP